MCTEAASKQGDLQYTCMTCVTRCSVSAQAASRQDDVQYASKLDEFEMFVSRAKYPPLQLRPLAPATTSTAASRPVIPASSSTAVTAAYNQPSQAAAAASSSHLRAASTPAAAAAAAAQHLQHQLQGGRSGHPPLPLSLPRLTLIDDVPHAADADARRRLSIALQVGGGGEGR